MTEYISYMYYYDFLQCGGLLVQITALCINFIYRLQQDIYLKSLTCVQSVQVNKFQSTPRLFVSCLNVE